MSADSVSIGFTIAVCIWLVGLSTSGMVIVWIREYCRYEDLRDHRRRAHDWNLDSFTSRGKDRFVKINWKKDGF